MGGPIRTRDDIAAAVEALPGLNAKGVGHFPARKMGPEEREVSSRRDRAELLDDVEGCTRAEDWLKDKGRTKRPKWSSYWLKHLVEAETGQYLTNGAFIAAAVHLGFAYRAFPRSPNVNIGVAVKDLRASSRTILEATGRLLII
jgi:hypothetical protein